MPPLQYIVEGGHRLAGTIEPSGNKNAALPIIAAAPLRQRTHGANGGPGAGTRRADRAIMG